MTARRKLILATIVIGVLLLVIFGGAPLVVTEVANTRSSYTDICLGSIWPAPSVELRGFGQFQSPPGQDSSPAGRGEVFKSDKIWYAWNKGDSKPVAVEARLKDCPNLSGTSIAIDQIYYRYSYSEDSLT